MGVPSFGCYVGSLSLYRRRSDRYRRYSIWRTYSSTIRNGACTMFRANSSVRLVHHRASYLHGSCHQALTILLGRAWFLLGSGGRSSGFLGPEANGIARLIRKSDVRIYNRIQHTLSLFSPSLLRFRKNPPPQTSSRGFALVNGYLKL